MDKWFSKTLSKAGGKLIQAQTRYKRQYYGHLRRHRETIKEADFVYLRVESRGETYARHKLVAMAGWKLPFVSVHSRTVVIKRVKESVERVSNDAVIPETPRLTTEEVSVRTRTMSDEELHMHDNLVESHVNLRDVFFPPAVHQGGTTSNE